MGRSIAAMRLLVLLVVVLECFHHSSAAANDVPSVIVYRDTKKVDVPPSFLGLSIEPIQHAPYYISAEEPSFVNMVSLLSSFNTGNFSIRWGGNEQDFLDYVLPKEVFEALAHLREKTGVRYMLGLNLKVNDPTLAYDQVREYLRKLDLESLESLNVGNEPDLYFTKDDQKWDEKYAQYEYWGQIQEYYYKIGRLLKYVAKNTSLFAAPDIANFASWSAGDIRTWATKKGFAEYAKVVTAHYYTSQALNEKSTWDYILLEDEMDFIARNADRWSSAAHEVGLKFKIDETNSLSGQGKLGVSDRMTSVLFTLDYIFTVMSTKTDGMNFHMGACKPYSAIQPPAVCMNKSEVGYNCDEHGEEIGCPGNTENATTSEVRPQFYALWMAQWILKDLPTMVQSSVTSVDWKNGNLHIKSYAFAARGPGYETRVLLLQKTCKRDINVVVKMPGGWSTAIYYVLQADSHDPEAPVDQISFANQKINKEGLVEGKQETIPVPSKWDGSYSTYTVKVPKCSAAVLIIR